YTTLALKSSSCALRFILLLFLSLPPLYPGAPMTGELRCQCLSTVSEVIQHKRIATVELIPEGPHCIHSEVIATLKNGIKSCLNPEAYWVKLIIRKIMNRFQGSS
uniref:C-X-C motif chemokine n=1 Tax=Sphenodon punctatus TaxID=8508 RepID=A0A8D0GX41_SPHPU